MKRKLALILLAVLLIFSMTACGSDSEKSQETQNVEKETVEESDNTEESESSEITITDMMDREVTIKKPIERVVLNQWDAAEFCMSVVGEDFVDMIKGVGITKGSENYQKVIGEKYPQLKDLPSVGGGKGRDYDVEKIISLEPDVFIINSSGSFSEGALDTAEKLDEAGIPTLFLTMSENPFSSPQEATLLIGDIFEREERAQEISEFLDEQFKVINSKNLAEKTDKPTFYQEKGSGTKDEYDVTSISDGWADLIEYAGGKNIAIGYVGESGKIDPEYLITTNPDYIFVTGSLGHYDSKEIQEIIDSSVGEYIQRTGWDKLKAVKNNDVYLFSHSHSRNQFAFYPALKIAKIFYPEEFKEINPDEKLKEFFDHFMLTDYEDGFWFYQLGDKLDG